MGTRTYVEAFDDLDGTTGEVTTVAFGLEGVSYEIDLNEKNLKKLRSSMEVFITSGRRTGGRKVTKTNIGPSGREVRDWARSNGLEVPERGVIPASIREAFEAANSK